MVLYSPSWTGLDICFDKENYHDALQSSLIEGIAHFLVKKIFLFVWEMNLAAKSSAIWCNFPSGVSHYINSLSSLLYITLVQKTNLFVPQIVRADLKELNELDLHGAPYAYTPFCDSRKEMDGFRCDMYNKTKNILQCVNAYFRLI